MNRSRALPWFVLVLVLAVGAAAAFSPSARARVGSGEDPRAAAFGAAAERILARKELEGALVGVDVRSLDRGERLWSRNAERPLAPASNLKLVTLVLALEVLGPGFQFETPVLASGPIVEGGKLEGDLWIRGSGDPTLRPCFFESEDDAAPLQPFVQALVLHGVRRIRGDLVVDARSFDDAFVPDGWPQDQLDRDYAAPVAALSLNGNCLRIRVTGRSGLPPLAALDPEISGWRVQNDLVESRQPKALQVAALGPDRDGAVRVRGSVGPEVGAGFVRTPVAHPPIYFGRALRAALERAGIQIGGVVRESGPEEALSEKARTLYTRRSALLPALLVCGKDSDNNVAEHLLKACALVQLGCGTVENGARLVRDLALRLGVDGELLRIADGSGLSRLDQLTPAFLTALLHHAYEAPWRDEFVRCLPISGVDGTLEKRMAEPAMQYRVRAKTGFIAGVSALSGYAMAGDEADQQVYAFSILVNGFKGANADMKKVQDDLCRALVAPARQ